MNRREDQKTELELVVALVAELNNRGMETVGCAPWSVHTNSEAISIRLFNDSLWYSEEDERREIGTCPHCKGRGLMAVPVKGGNIRIPLPDDEVDNSIDPRCASCGGSGTDHQLEPLERFLLRTAFERALEIMNMVRPRADLEEPMPHDVEVRGEWIGLLRKARVELGMRAPQEVFDAFSLAVNRREDNMAAERMDEGWAMANDRLDQITELLHRVLTNQDSGVLDFGRSLQPEDFEKVAELLYKSTFYHSAEDIYEICHREGREKSIDAIEKAFRVCRQGGMGANAGPFKKREKVDVPEGMAREPSIGVESKVERPHHKYAGKAPHEAAGWTPDTD